MSTPTVQTLLTPITQQQIISTILAYLKQNNFPVQDFEPGSVTGTMILAFTTALQDYATNSLPLIAAGDYVDYSTGDWLTLLSQQRFGIDRVEATNTIGQIVFDTTASNSGPYSITDGELLIQFNSTGNIYTNQGAAIIAQGTTTTLNFISQYPNNSLATPTLNYVDATGYSSATGGITLITSLPGVIVTNPSVPVTSATFTHAGSGTGTIVPSAYTGTDSMNIVITIISNGQAGVTEWNYSVNAGASVAGTSSAFTITYLGSSITFTLTDSANNPSFVEQDVYTINLPTSWITTQGRDVETDPALQQRDKDVWGFTSSIPTTSNLELLLHQASDQVVLTEIITDGYVNNKVNAIVAGQGGIVLSPATITQIQQYVQARVSITDYIVVQSPIQENISIAGNVFVSISATTPSETQVEANIGATITEYLGTLNINGTIRISEIIRYICDVIGVSYVNISSMTINGSNTDYVLGDNNTNIFKVINFSTLSFSGLTYTIV